MGKTCLLQRYLTGKFAETISVSRECGDQRGSPMSRQVETANPSLPAEYWSIPCFEEVGRVECRTVGMLL